MKNNRMVEEIDVTILYNGKEFVQEFLFDREEDEQALSEEDMSELGFCGDVFLEDENGDEIKISLDASNPEYFDGTLIDGLVYNLYRLNQLEEPFDEASVIGVKVFFYED